MTQTKKEFQSISNTEQRKTILKKVINFLCLGLFLLSTIQCKKMPNPELVNVSEELQLIKINDYSYVHISQIKLKNGAQFPCNGFVYLFDKEAYIFDSPVTDQATSELINWLQNDQKSTIKGVVFNHFHNDCTEGIEIFKNNKITTIASKKTKQLMVKAGYQEPDQVFENYLELKLGKKSIHNTFFGEAHSPDNIISYFPEEKILFGGCMIKSINARKGNLADANIVEWPNTVKKIKRAFPELKIVIPGHGQYGDQRLLDYTITLFNTKN